MRNYKKERVWLTATYQRVEIRYRKDSIELEKLKQLAGNKTLSQFVKEIVDEKIKNKGDVVMTNWAEVISENSDNILVVMESAQRSAWESYELGTGWEFSVELYEDGSTVIAQLGQGSQSQSSYNGESIYIASYRCEKLYCEDEEVSYGDLIDTNIEGSDFVAQLEDQLEYLRELQEQEQRQEY